MANTIRNYLKNYPFSPGPNSTDGEFSILIDEDAKTITSIVNTKIQYTLKLKKNNELHKLLCIRLLVHLSCMRLYKRLLIRLLKRCEERYDNDIFMKEKKNQLGFTIGVLSQNKSFAKRNFEEWKTNSQDSSANILEMAEEGDLYNDTPPTIAIGIGFPGMDERGVSVDCENTYLRIQNSNKEQYTDMGGLIEICNICGYWK